MLSSADDVNGTLFGESNALRGDFAKSSEPRGGEIEVEVSIGVSVRRVLKSDKKKKGEEEGEVWAEPEPRDYVGEGLPVSAGTEGTGMAGRPPLIGKRVPIKAQHQVLG